jgi:hypothetical protein
MFDQADKGSSERHIRKLWLVLRTSSMGIALTWAIFALLKSSGNLPGSYTWWKIITFPALLIGFLPVLTIAGLWKDHWLWQWSIAVMYTVLLLLSAWSLL